MTHILLYITTRDRDQALSIGRQMVEQRLCACANVLDGMHSVYRWQGRIEESDEAVLVLKTREELKEPLLEAVKSIHTYECPCIVSLPITGGNPSFLEWISNETRVS